MDLYGTYALLLCSSHYQHCRGHERIDKRIMEIASGRASPKS